MATSTIDHTKAPMSRQRASTNGHSEAHREWEARTRIFLTPIAAPSILGLFGFATSTFMVAAFLAGWYGQDQGNVTVLSNLAPLCLFFGGVAQFAAGMWSYRARDALGTAAHGMWGAFWMAFGVLFILAGAHVLHLASSGPLGQQLVPFGYWFYPLAVITGCLCLAAVRRNLGFTLVLFTLSIGAACVGIGYTSGVLTWLRVAGYDLVVAAALAIFTAFSLLLVEANEGREILPLGKWPFHKKESWKPGAVVARPQEYVEGMPGSRVGQ